MRFDEDGALTNSIDANNLIVDDFSISMETTGGDTSCLNVNNERHNIIIHTMVISGLLDINQNEQNGALQNKHQKKSIYARSIVN